MNFQYLKKGCTQYFTSKLTDKLMTKLQLSTAQRNKGGLSDLLLDDVTGFKMVSEVSLAYKNYRVFADAQR